MGCKGVRVSNIPKVVKMCSITNTAHPTRRHACLGVGVCDHVYMFKCLRGGGTPLITTGDSRRSL